MDNQKAFLRSQIKRKLVELTELKRKSIQVELQQKLMQSLHWKEAKVIGITISVGYEWDTKQLIQEAWHQGKKVVVPKCNPKEKSLTFYQLEAFDQLETVYYQLQEPNPMITRKVSSNEIDLLIVPGLLFDDAHYRIGHGGGYYDRFLESFSGKTVSLAWVEQVIPSIPTEPFDIPVNELIVSS